VELKLNEQVSIFAEGMYRFLEISKVEVDGNDINLNDDKIKMNGLAGNAGFLLRF